MDEAEILLLEDMIGSFIAMLYYLFFLVLMISSFYFSEDLRNRNINVFIRNSTLFFVSCYVVSFLLKVMMTIHEFGEEMKSVSDLAYLSSEEYLWFYILTNFLWLVSRIAFYILFIGRLYFTFRNSIYQSNNIVFVFLGIGLFFEFLLLTFLNVYVFALSKITNDKIILYSGIGVLLIDVTLALSILFLFVNKLFLLIMSRTKDLVSGKLDSKKYQREMSKSYLSYDDLRNASPSVYSVSNNGNNGNNKINNNNNATHYSSAITIPNKKNIETKKSRVDSNTMSSSIAETPKQAPSFVALRTGINSFRLSPQFGQSISSFSTNEMISSQILNHNNEYQNENETNKKHSDGSQQASSLNSDSNDGNIESNSSSNLLSPKIIQPNNNNNDDYNELSPSLNNSLSASMMRPKTSFSMSSRNTIGGLWRALDGVTNDKGTTKMSISGDNKRLVAKLDGKAIILINTVSQQTLLSTVAMISSVFYMLIFLMNYWDVFEDLPPMPHILQIYRCVDRMIAMTCVYLGFRFSKKAYKIVCGKPHKWCKYCCEGLAKSKLKKRYTKHYTQTQLAEFLLVDQTG